jgi:hypothetical protein
MHCYETAIYDQIVMKFGTRTKEITQFKKRTAERSASISKMLAAAILKFTATP